MEFYCSLRSVYELAQRALRVGAQLRIEKFKGVGDAVRVGAYLRMKGVEDSLHISVAREFESLS